ncbi:MAG: helix-turn-helix domain-containing protein [Micavibrio sp.]
MQMKPSPPPICYTVEQACAATGIGKTKLYEALDSGVLPAKKWGKRTLILKSELQRYLSNLEAYAPQTGGQHD